MSSYPFIAGSSSKLAAPPAGYRPLPHPRHSTHPHHSPGAGTATHPAGGKWKWALAVLAILGAMAIGVALSGGSGEPGVDLMRSMESAAKGNLPPAGTTAPRVQIERSGDGVTVSATGVAPSDCVSSGWQLVRKGVLTINGTTPQRVSAAMLTELCYQGASATLQWVPRREP